uniref:Uncharacterized protein n=1 Tax=Aegilops tauschii subsp. strangulata TaxID=200361 RepID=A0A453RXH1_AEGTS
VGLLPQTNAAAQAEVLGDAWDYRGRPAARSTTGRWGAAAMILVAELNERLTTLGIAVNLVTYLTATMHVGNAEAANVVTNFMGTSFMLCLLGGFVADSFLGRYLTIAIFTAIQVQGVTILTISTAAPGLRPPACTAEGGGIGTCSRASGAQLGVLYLALYLTALGTGGLKSSVSGFGSDQFDESDRTEKSQMMRFFNWFFFFISLGSLLAVTVLVYVQDNLGRPWGYGACAASIAVGLVVFLAGTRRYRFKKLAGSPLTQIAAVVVAAWRKRGVQLPTDTSMLYDIDVGKVVGEDDGEINPIHHLLALVASQAVVAKSERNVFLGPCGDQLGPRRRADQVAARDADGRGGGQDGGADASDMGDDHHVLDGVRADDHLLGVAGHHHGPPHWPLLSDPGGLPHRLLRRLHPPHRTHLRPHRRARIPPPQRQPARAHPAAADRHRPRALHPRHDLRRSRRGQAPPRGAGLRRPSGRPRAHDGLLAHPAVLFCRRRRGLHLHRPARLLPARVPQGDEDHEHGALPQHALARILRQLGARHRRAQDHG